MKALLKSVSVVLVAVFTVMGCGSDKKGSNNDAWNPYDDFYYNFGNYQMNPNARVAAGTLNFSDGHSGGAWKAALEALGFCYNGGLSSCHQLDDAPPHITLVLDDSKFTNGVSRGTVMISSRQVSAVQYPVTWKKVNGGTTIDTQVRPTMGYLPSQGGYRNAQLRIVILGNPHDGASAVSTEFYYGPTRIGDGQLTVFNPSAHYR